jgi:hypothetical protein
MNQKVLQKLLKPKASEEKVEEYLKPQKIIVKKITKSPGRPKVADEKKARNFTLCLAPAYLKFLDQMQVKDPKVQGRGRKIRFIIDRFVEHERRSLHQLKVIKESLNDVQKLLSSFGERVKKGHKLELSNKEKSEITQVVDKVYLVMKLLGHTPKTLKSRLPTGEWSVLTFCQDWKINRGVIL